MSSDIRTDGRLSYFAANAATISVADGRGVRKAVHITMRPDGSVFVQVPYLPPTTAILTAIELSADGSRQETLDLAASGKTTSHKIKLSHHSDGTAHFSQDGKIYTAIRRRAFPLPTGIGPLFQVDIVAPELLESFTLADARKKRSELRFVFDADLPPAISVGAVWRRKSELATTATPLGGSTGPVTTIPHLATGEPVQVILFGHPEGHSLQDNLLAVSCSPAAVPEGASRGHLLLMGGLNWEQQTATAGARPTGMLVMLAPVADPDVLTKLIGSVDFIPKVG